MHLIDVLPFDNLHYSLLLVLEFGLCDILFLSRRTDERRQGGGLPPSGTLLRTGLQSGTVRHAMNSTKLITTEKAEPRDGNLLLQREFDAAIPDLVLLFRR